MAKNITLMGASYSDVPSVLLPVTGGGTASFVDVSDTTATASTILSGYGAYGADGTWIDGTATSGGGAGISMEDVANSTGTTCVITGTDISTISMYADYAMSLEALEGYTVSVDYASASTALE